MFDTLRYSKILEGVGVSRDQAEAHVQIIAEIVEGELATKQDIKDLKTDLERMESRLLIKLGALTTGLLTLAVAIIAIMIQRH